ncbi:MAG: TrkH family potassium uptake protein [Bacteroidia bacterium]
MPFFQASWFLHLLRWEAPVEKVMLWIRTLGTMASVGLMVLYFGFPLTLEGQFEIINYQNSLLGIFGLRFLIRGLYARFELKYLFNNPLETLLLGLWAMEGLSAWLDQPWFATRVTTYSQLLPYAWFVHTLAIGLAGQELIRLSNSVVTVQLKPAATLIVSFLLLIAVGTGLFMLPQMSVGRYGLDFEDALFTSVSATCVTGLSTIDVGHVLTLKGQWVLLGLIQLGGIGILTFATFFALFLKKGVGISHQAMIKDFMSEENLFDAKKLLGQIIFYSLFFELGGALMIYMAWPVEAPFAEHSTRRAFHSVFHSVSAFNNAGFSLYTNGLAEPFLYHAPILRMVITLLVVFGGLGFPVLRDLMGYHQLVSRIRSPWKKWKLSTRISVWTAVTLLLLGAVLFGALEYQPGGTLAGQESGRIMVDSLLASASARTAGFNTLDVMAFGVPSCLLLIFLMFIGGGSGSTAGGIKTSTFTLLVLAVWSTIRNKRQLELGGRSIPFELLNKAYTIFFFAATYVFGCVFLLAVLEPQIPILDLVFEEVSAFGTVGLSRGPTMAMGSAGRAILMVSMFVGRVGTLTLAFALASRSENQNYSLPKSHVLIG